MTAPAANPGAPLADACAELRQAVAVRCGEARAAAQGHSRVEERTRLLRRDLVAAQHRLSVAEEAADPLLRSAEKARAREVYLAALEAASTDAERSEAAAVWAHALDRVNRGARLAARAVAKARAEVSGLERAVPDADREEQAARIRAESAEAACLDARVRLAACEERVRGRAAAPAIPERPTTAPPVPGGATPGPRIRAVPDGDPLVIESMVSGDRRALELAAAAIAEHGRISPAEVRVQLQELVDAIDSAASTDGYLRFDERHPFWASLSVSEARDVVAALTRLGFRFEPAEGWHAGRAPTPSDLAMALAWAGVNARNVRGLPNAADLQALPASIGVDARAFLAAYAPDLAMDQLVRLLDVRAAKLGPLWDAWGLVRPVLLSPRRQLGSLPG
jgi:hypothetical protein